MMRIKFKRLLPVLVLLTLVGVCAAAGTKSGIYIGSPITKPINLNASLQILEDKQNRYTYPELLQHPEKFSPQTQLPINGKNNTNTFWLYTSLQAKNATEAVLYFDFLSYVDVYLYPDTPGATALHHKAGVFRPLNEISAGDSRFHCSFNIAPNVPYLILLKVKHTKKYTPVFDFYLANKADYHNRTANNNLTTLFFLGIFCTLLLFALLSWLITKYKPYLWVAVMLVGTMLYDLSLNHYFIDWLSPNRPIVGWLCIGLFSTTGVVGFFLLLLAFLQVKTKNAYLHKMGIFVVGGSILLAFISFAINFGTGNFSLSARLYIVGSVFSFVYLIVLLFKIWKQLDKDERVFCYGIIAYIAAAIPIFAFHLLMSEKAVSLMPFFIKFLSACISLVFIICINNRLRQNEKDKLRYLDELNQLQKHQNEILEESVAARTAELAQRNQHIETLMNELNHRVKNNLQLLYSLNSLQLPNASDKSTSQLIKDNISRIKAMMLVNDGLNPNQTTEEKNISLFNFITEIITHSKKMFESERTAAFKIEVEKHLMLDSRIGLSLGIIISELITNSYKHAFVSQPQPHITIGVSLSGTNWHMKYADNGKGMPASNSHSLGLSLINDLTRQLKGTVDTINDNGLVYLFNFPTTS